MSGRCAGGCAGVVARVGGRAVRGCRRGGCATPTAPRDSEGGDASQGSGRTGEEKRAVGCPVSGQRWGACAKGGERVLKGGKPWNDATEGGAEKGGLTKKEQIGFWPRTFSKSKLWPADTAKAASCPVGSCETARNRKRESLWLLHVLAWAPPPLELDAFLNTFLTDSPQFLFAHLALHVAFLPNPKSLLR